MRPIGGTLIEIHLTIDLGILTHVTCLTEFDLVLGASKGGELCVRRFSIRNATLPQLWMSAQREHLFLL